MNWLIEQVHEQRGLDPKFLVTLRDRLAASEDATVRAASIDVGALLPRLDAVFAEKMLSDRSPLVRAAVAEHLERVETLDRDAALGLIRRCLGQETHRSVLSPLYVSLGALFRRSSNRSEPPEGKH